MVSLEMQLPSYGALGLNRFQGISCKCRPALALTQLALRSGCFCDSKIPLDINKAPLAPVEEQPSLANELSYCNQKPKSWGG